MNRELIPCQNPLAHNPESAYNRNTLDRTPFGGGREQQEPGIWD